MAATFRRIDAPQMRKPFFALVLFTIPALLLAFSVVMSREFAHVRDLRMSVEQSVTVRGNLIRLLSLHQDLETGQRGYALTGDPAFLQPYRKARADMRDGFLPLDDLARHATYLAPGLSRLHRLSQQKIRFSQGVVQTVAAGRSAQGLAMVRTGQGKQVMDAIRVEIGRLDALELARSRGMSGVRDGSRNRLERNTQLLLAGLALLLAAITAFTGRTIRQRQRALAMVQDLSDRQQAQFDGADDGMMLLDDKGFIREINPSVTRMFGYDEAALIGRHNTFLMDRPVNLATSQAWLRSVGAAGFGGAGRRQEFTGLRENGTVFDTDVAVSRISDDGAFFYVAAIRDVTERKRVEALKSEFVSTVSHELRTPLTSIGGALGLLAAGATGPLGDKAARLVAIAHSNCERLIRLINDILDIEKIESGKLQFAQEEVALDVVITRTLAANSQFAGDRAVSLRQVPCDTPLLVLGDADRIEQLLTNLVSNAIKHSCEDGTVEVSLTRDGACARIEVRDRGAGIPVEFRDRIFGKFAMADGSDSRSRGGTGLGLSIAREIATHHGGSVGYQDRDGGGTIFFTLLPLLNAPAGTECCDDDAHLPTVLHVDDDRDCLSVVASAFAGRARIVAVDTLARARAEISRQQLAGAIVDIEVLPHNGLDLIPELRAVHPDAVIVLFTAHDDLRAGNAADAVLIKSRASLDQLVSAVLVRLAIRERAA